MVIGLLGVVLSFTHGWPAWIAFGVAAISAWIGLHLATTEVRSRFDRSNGTFEHWVRNLWGTRSRTSGPLSEIEKILLVRAVGVPEGTWQRFASATVFALTRGKLLSLDLSGEALSGTGRILSELDDNVALAKRLATLIGCPLVEAGTDALLAYPPFTRKRP